MNVVKAAHTAKCSCNLVVTYTGKGKFSKKVRAFICKCSGFCTVSCPFGKPTV